MWAMMAGRAHHGIQVTCDGGSMQPLCCQLKAHSVFVAIHVRGWRVQQVMRGARSENSSKLQGCGCHRGHPVVGRGCVVNVNVKLRGWGRCSCFCRGHGLRSPSCAHNLTSLVPLPLRLRRRDSRRRALICCSTSSRVEALSSGWAANCDHGCASSRRPSQ